MPKCSVAGCAQLAAYVGAQRGPRCLEHAFRPSPETRRCARPGCRNPSIGEICEGCAWEATHDRGHSDSELASATAELRRVCDRLDETNERLAALVAELRSRRRQG